MEENDWRLAANEKLFKEAVFVRKTYRRWSPEWDHDHCSFCHGAFAEEGTEADRQTAFHEGYSTPGPPGNPKEDYYWVCPQCFDDFRHRLGWTLRHASGNPS